MDVTHHSYGRGKIEFSEEAFEAMMTLKKFNEKKIYHTDHIRGQEKKFQRIVLDLFDVYLEDLGKGDENSAICSSFLGEMSDHYRSSTLPARIVADYISGMTDGFVLDQYLSRFMPEQAGYAARPD